MSSRGIRKTKEQFIIDARSAHGDKYDYSRVNYIKALNKVEIVCPKHGPFWMAPAYHATKSTRHGCPKCKGDACSKRQTQSVEHFLEEARRIHGDRYDYSKINYVNKNTKIEIVCKFHGSFWQLPVNHTATKQGCPLCAIQINADRLSYGIDGFLERARKTHGNKYDYSKVNYIRTHLPIEIICPLHGTFWQVASEHLYGKGCNACAGRLVVDTPSFVQASKDIHGDVYDYSKVSYTKGKEQVEIICKKHGSFWQRAADHKTGAGCPNCCLSRGERKIKLWLERHNVQYMQQATFSDCVNPSTNRRMKFDFFLPIENTLVEFDGVQHFKCGRLGGYFSSPKDLVINQEKDRLKTEYALSKGIGLIRITYKQIKKVREILDAKLGTAKRVNNPLSSLVLVNDGNVF